MHSCLSLLDLICSSEGKTRSVCYGLIFAGNSELHISHLIADPKSSACDRLTVGFWCEQLYYHNLSLLWNKVCIWITDLHIAICLIHYLVKFCVLNNNIYDNLHFIQIYKVQWIGCMTFPYPSKAVFNRNVYDYYARCWKL